MLVIEDIWVSYGKAQALAGVSMNVEAGELVTLLGANGAGKTTLIKTVSGMLRPKSGRILFNGQDILAVPPHRIVGLGIVQVAENRELFPEMTVIDNLRLGAFTRRDSGVARDLDFVMDIFPRLRERRSQLAGTLSGGEAQMLAIGRALLAAPKLLMLDEPSLGLSPLVRDLIFTVIRQIYEEKGLTVLLVEQNAAWALQVCSRGYVLENGRMILDAPGSELTENEHVKRAYLGY